MRAVVHRDYGEPAEVLGVERLPVPEPERGEVLVRVAAAGVDQGVWHLVSGLPYLVRLAGYGLRAPKNPVPGLDLAGVVTAVGEGVRDLEPGEPVFGVGVGSFAELARARADRLAPVPAGTGLPEAAVLGVSGVAALQAVRDRARVEPGEEVLITGAAGGVGSYAVQIAVDRGARVTGVSSGPKADFVRSLGAADVIDYTSEEIDASGRRWDAIIDVGGGRGLMRLRRALRRRGRLVIVGAEGGGRWLGGTDRQLRAIALSPFVSQKLGALVSSENAEDLRALAELTRSGALVPSVSRSYPLEDAARALEDLRAGRARGKLVIEP